MDDPEACRICGDEPRLIVMEDPCRPKFGLCHAHADAYCGLLDAGYSTRAALKHLAKAKGEKT